MSSKLYEYLYAQFCGTIEMLIKAIDHCPEEIWNEGNGFPDFWYTAYHTTFWLDFYLTGNPDSYKPYKDFGLTEFDPAGILPEREFSKEEIKLYALFCLEKCKFKIKNLTEEESDREFIFGTLSLPYFELLIYNMRHVQHHTAQLNLLLRQKIDSAPGWVRRSNS